MMRTIATAIFFFLSIDLPAQFEFDGGPFGALVVDMDVSDSLAYAATLHGLYRSFGKGETWERIIDLPVHSTLLSSVSAGVEVKWKVKAHGSEVLFFYYAEIPNSTNTNFFLLYSNDFGDTWQPCNFPAIGNQQKRFGTWEIQDSLIYMQAEKLLFYSYNKGLSWNLMELPGFTEGFIFDREDMFYWSADSIYHCTDFPNAWQSYPIDIPQLEPNSLQISKGYLFARSFDQISGYSGFWASKCLECPRVPKPELAWNKDFGIAVTDDSVFVWPRFNWEADRLWISDTSMLTFVRDSNRQTPVAYFKDLMNTNLLTVSDTFYIYSSQRISFRPYDDFYHFPSVWRSDDNGFEWNNIEDGIFEPLINDCMFEDSAFWVSTSYGLFKKELADSEWVIKGQTDWPTISIARFDDKLWRISALGNYQIVYFSDDNGDNWTPDIEAGTGQLVSTPGALFLSSGNGFVLRRLPAQDQWDDISANLPDILTQGVLDVFFQGKIFLYDGSGILYSSEDLGNNWQAFPFPTNIYTPIRFLTTIEDDLYFVLGRKNPGVSKFELEIYKWKDNTQSWQQVSDKLKLDYTWQNQNDFRKITGFLKSGENWFLGIRGHGIYRSIDGAVNWEVLSEDEVSRNSFSLDISNNWLYNTSQFFGVWKMWLGNTSSLESHPELDVKVFPNPTTGIIKLDTYEKCTVEVYDIRGRRIFKQPINNNVVDLSSLESGTYVLKFSNDTQLKIEKIIKCR